MQSNTKSYWKMHEIAVVFQIYKMIIARRNCSAHAFVIAHKKQTKQVSRCKLARHQVHWRSISPEDNVEKTWAKSFHIFLIKTLRRVLYTVASGFAVEVKHLLIRRAPLPNQENCTAAGRSPYSSNRGSFRIYYRTDSNSQGKRILTWRDIFKILKLQPFKQRSLRTKLPEALCKTEDGYANLRRRVVYAP